RRRGDLRRQCGGHGMGILGTIDMQRLGHPVDAGGFLGQGGAVVGEHQHVDGVRGQFDRAAHGARGGGIEFAVQMVGDDQYLVAHSRPFSLSLLTSSSTLSTMTPASRLGGGAVFVVSSCAAACTPRSSRLVSSMVLRLAFMMSGSFR